MVSELAQAKRADIARALQDDGIEVIAAAPGAGAIVQTVAEERPDVLIVDTTLLRKAGPDAIGSIRASSPATKILVVTRATRTASAPGADGYLQARTNPASVSSAVIDLVGEPILVMPEAAPATTAGATAPPAAAKAPPAPATESTTATASTRPTVVLPEARYRRDGRLVASRVLMIAGIAIIAGSLIYAGLSGDDTEPVAQAPAPPVDEGVEVPAVTTTALDGAYTLLDDLVASLEAARYVEARVNAGLLMEQRDASLAAGFALFALDSDITDALGPYADLLSQAVCTTLTGILGDLMPSCMTTPTGGGGGGSGGGGTLFFGGGTAIGGGTQTSGGTSRGGGGGGGGGVGGTTEDFPGQGVHKGWEHKPPKGGWHGGPPPGHWTPPWRVAHREPSDGR
jgi:DNA-binding NarL/FixJ family response regulator